MKLDPDFLKKYDRPGPRYTSYPPAPHFLPDPDSDKYLQAVEKSNFTKTKNISFYVHIPFCPHRCLFCGCNTEIGRGAGFIKKYRDRVLKEIDTVIDKLDASRPLTQIHFGGGTPNAIPMSFLEDILKQLSAKFTVADIAEFAIECDPALLTHERLENLRAMGFNRISFGVQDFNLEVLKTVERKIPKKPISDWVKHARHLGFKGINIDLIYGLPHQTPESFHSTIIKALESEPDRLAVFSYAHVPWLKPHQKKLEEPGLPEAEQKLAMAVDIFQTFTEAGYVPIGFDHFAKPDDELGKAVANENLHRNFQGFCTRQTTGQVYAFGASAISQFDLGYFQNTKETTVYMERLENDKTAIEKAYYLDHQEIFFREVIFSLLCNGKLDPDELAKKNKMKLETINQWLEKGMENIFEMEKDGLVSRQGTQLQTTHKGRLAARCLAMAFDPLLQNSKARYSRTI